MSIAVVTVATANITWYTKYTLPIQSAWCSKNVYDHIVFNKKLSEDSKSIHWSKIVATQKLIVENKYSWILWIDADAVPMNIDFKLESILDNEYDAILSGHSYRDKNTNKSIFSFNSGVFIFKSTKWSEMFLNYVYTAPIYRHYWNDLFHEQSAIWDSVINFKNLQIDKHIKIMKNPTLTDYYDNLSGNAYPTFKYSDIKAPFFHNYGSKKNLLPEIRKYVKNYA